MKAIVYRRYGSPDVLGLGEIQKPIAKPGDVLVRVHAASVNALDWHMIRGKPYVARLDMGLRAPKSTTASPALTWPGRSRRSAAR